MSAFADMLSLFRRDEIGLDDLLARISRLGDTGEEPRESMLAALDRENGELPLPPQVYEMIVERIGATGQADAPLPGGLPGNAAPGPMSHGDDGMSTRVQTTPATVPAAAGGGTVAGEGTTLNDRFVLEECLGSGGMGLVFKALDLRKVEAQDRTPYVALKVLSEEFRTHPDSLVALQREAKKTQALAHPSIVTVYDFDRDGDLIYMTMEYLVGRPLDRITKAPNFRGLPSADALRLVRSIGEALAFAHQNGLVHSDFKPGNVFITDDDKVKLIDFGISRVIGRPADADQDATRFDPGDLRALTPAYASPEMIEGGEPDPRDDIYALACITYELLTGKHPFARLSATDARDRGLAPGERPRALGRAQWKGLQRALAFDRKARTPTVTRFLEDIAGDATAGGRRFVTAAAAAAVLLIAAGGIAYKFIPWSPPAIIGDPSQPDGPSSITIDDGEIETPIETPPPPLSLAGLAPHLSATGCSILHASIEGGAVAINGFAGANADLATLERMLKEIPGVTSVNRKKVVPVDGIYCAMLDTFAPYATAGGVGGPGVSLRTLGGSDAYSDKDNLLLEITTPDHDAYLYLDYYQTDGKVGHLEPAMNSTAAARPPGASEALGPWELGPPFGTDLIVALVTPEPLFDTPRYPVEEGEKYLSEIERRLRSMIERLGDERVGVEVLAITVLPRL